MGAGAGIEAGAGEKSPEPVNNGLASQRWSALAMLPVE